MFSKVKQHISSNRGKYGTAVGAGAAYGASQIPTVVDNVPILANQAIYNGMVKGNNLLQSGKEAIGMNAGPKVNQDEIDMVNDYYNSPLAKVYNPTPGQMIQAGNSTNEFINDTKDNYNNATGYVVDKYNQAKDYIGESTVSTHTINIKQALLEGYTAQEIVEAVHADQGLLDRQYSRGEGSKSSARDAAAQRILDIRKNRDNARESGLHDKANFLDNEARASSYDPRKAAPIARYFENERKDIQKDKIKPLISSKPRIISSAKK